MKKILLLLCVFLLTGCKSQLVCNRKTTEEFYEEEQKIIYSFNDDKVQDVTINYIMIFEDEETAKTYLTIFESLEKDYEIKLNKNKINIKSNENYEKYEQNKDELKKELEQNGFSCR